MTRSFTFGLKRLLASAYNISDWFSSIGSMLLWLTNWSVNLLHLLLSTRSIRKKSDFYQSRGAEDLPSLHGKWSEGLISPSWGCNPLIYKKEISLCWSDWGVGYAESIKFSMEKEARSVKSKITHPTHWVCIDSIGNSKQTLQNL